jgi:hypothetical protein
MAETTFERAVKAAALSDGFTAKELSTTRGDPRLDPTPEYEDIVRAVLQAIRDGLPESVIRAGDNADYFCSEGIHISRMIDDDGIQTVFTAMIDAILSQSQEGNHP